MAKRDRERIKSAETLFDVIDTLYRLDGAGITTVAEELGLTKSTVYRHVSTLRDMGYAVQEGNTYHLSLEFLRLGTHVRTRKIEYNQGRSIVEDLARETDERAQFLVLERGQMVCVHREIGERAVLANSDIGKHLPVHATASGKAVLSELPDERVRELVGSESLRSYTDRTIIDPEELLDHLETIRTQGYSLNDEEYIEGLRGIGVPVSDSNGGLVGALTISAPTHRLKGDILDQQVTVLQGAANELQLNIAYEAE